MKKKLAIVFTTFALAIAVAINVNFINQNDFSSISLKNIEALSSEGSEGGARDCFKAKKAARMDIQKKNVIVVI